MELTARANDKPSWQEALWGISSENKHRALTQRFTALWEDANGQLVACALIAQPGCNLTFQVQSQAQGQDIETNIMAWGLAQTQFIAQARGSRPELQRHGLGRALLLTGLSQLQARGATGAYLETSESHVPAQRLFASVGFTHLSSWQWYAKTVEPR